MVFIVILAGGGGERLWPLSRKNRPKQCISLDGHQTLIQRTYQIAVEIVGSSNVFVSTRDALVPIISKQLPDAQLIIEPLARDSAAAIGYVCTRLIHTNDEDTTVFMGADYHIPDVTHFKDVISAADEFARQDKIVTIGIKPTRVETRFGYINPGSLLSSGSIHVFDAVGFTEKPSEMLAREYIAHGYLWNSGMFIAKPQVLYRKIQQYMPNLYSALEQIRAAEFDKKIATEIFMPLAKISIDYGVIEKTNDLVVVRGDFIWDDIGTWDSLGRIISPDKNGNIVKGEFLGIDVRNSVIFGEKPIVAFGISDIVLIETDDCIFMCPKDKARDIKVVFESLAGTTKFQSLLNYPD
ncbi:MAG: mannose-1-phosphate guanylyltransferase [Candidatus Heimdallarchaeota archaeon]